MVDEKQMGPAQLILGYLGQLSAVIVLGIPACTTFVHICKQRSVGELSSLPYLAALFNSGVWILCAQISDDQFVRWLNIGGAFVQAVYLIIIFACSSTVQRPWLFGYCLSTIVGYSVLVGFFFTGRRSYFDLVCMLSGVVSAASPLLNLGTVWHHMSMRSMPPWPVPTVSLVNCIVWTSYACAGNDIIWSVA
ncbi:hypothetical protein BRADI_5g14935v3, partial [Brachypodium distachyon]